MDGSGGPPTIYDVARAAGVSIASVSRVLNGRRNPLPDTKERVGKAAAKAGTSIHEWLERHVRAAADKELGS